MLTNKIEKIFIIHYKPLINRKNYLINYFSNNNIKNFEFRDLYQRENLTPELSNSYFKLNNLNPSQICITIEHIETYRHIINTGSYNKWYLILEDDAKFTDNFIETLNLYMNNIPDDAEYLDINDYSLPTSINNTNNYWLPMNYTRTNCSYLINKYACEKLLAIIIPFKKAIDHELNAQFIHHNIKCYWSKIFIIRGHTNGSSYVQYR